MSQTPLDREARAAALGGTIRLADARETERLIEQLVDCVLAPPSAVERILGAVHSLATRVGIRPKRARGSTLAPLVAIWDLLNQDLRRAVLAGGADRVYAAACEGRASPAVAVRRAAVLAMHDLASAESLGQLVGLLTDEDATVAGAADRALLALVKRWTEDCSDAPDLHRVGECLVSAMRAVGDERLGGPHAAVVLLATPRRTSPASGESIPALTAWLDSPQEHAQAVGRILRGSRDPESRLRAWQWLSRAALSSACVDRLCRAYDLADHEIVLTSMHLAINPRRLSAVRAIGRTAFGAVNTARVSGGEVAAARHVPIRASGPLPRCELVPELSPRGKWGLAIWVNLIHAPAAVRQTVLAPLLCDPSPGVRLSAARLVSANDLADFCFDEDVAVARTAMNRWSILGVAARSRYSAAGRSKDAADRARLLQRLTRSPHAVIRRMAHVDLLRVDPSSSVAGPHGDVAASVCAATDPTRVLASIESFVEHEDPALCAAAVRAAQRSGLLAALQDRLARRLVAPGRADDAPETATPEPSANDRLAATLVTALSEVAPQERTPACEGALVAALEHHDPRVRSNAVDGLARHGRRHQLSAVASALVELKNDPHHRVRGSALRGLLWLADPHDHAPIESIMDMLGDSRPLHRLAAAWLAERWAVSGLARPHELGPAIQRLRELAESDGDLRVAARAARAQRRARLLAGLADFEEATEYAA